MPSFTFTHPRIFSHFDNENSMVIHLWTEMVLWKRIGNFHYNEYFLGILFPSTWHYRFHVKSIQFYCISLMGFPLEFDVYMAAFVGYPNMNSSFYFISLVWSSFSWQNAKCTFHQFGYVDVTIILWWVKLMFYEYAMIFNTYIFDLFISTLLWFYTIGKCLVCSF